MHLYGPHTFLWKKVDNFKWLFLWSLLRTAQMMIFSLVAMIGLEKCCLTSACLQWLCHSGERIVARGPLVSKLYVPLFFSGLLSYLVGMKKKTSRLVASRNNNSHFLCYVLSPLKPKSYAGHNSHTMWWYLVGTYIRSNRSVACK